MLPALENGPAALDRHIALQQWRQIGTGQWKPGRRVAGGVGRSGRTGDGQQGRMDIEKVAGLVYHAPGCGDTSRPVSDKRRCHASLVTVVFVIPIRCVGDLGPVSAEARPAAHGAEWVVVADLLFLGPPEHEFG